MRNVTLYKGFSTVGIKLIAGMRVSNKRGIICVDDIIILNLNKVTNSLIKLIL